MVPHEVNFALHIADLGVDRDDRVLLRHDDHVLAERAIAAVGVVTAAPELIAVALQPVVLRIRARGLGGRGLLDFERRRFRDPRRGQKLAALPDALLQIELAEFRERLGRHAQAPAAGVDAARTNFPRHAADAERFEQARREVIENFLAGEFLDDGRAHVGGGAVIHERAARRVRDGRGEETPHPILFLHHVVRRLLRVADRHREQVAYAQRREIFADGGGHIVGEEFRHLVVHRQPALGDGEADRGGGEALAQGIERVLELRPIGRPPAFGHDAPVAREHKAVQFDLRLRRRVEKREDARRRNPFRLRRTARQTAGAAARTPRLTTWQQRRQTQPGHTEPGLREEISTGYLHARSLFNRCAERKPEGKKAEGRRQNADVRGQKAASEFRGSGMGAAKPVGHRLACGERVEPLCPYGLCTIPDLARCGIVLAGITDLEYGVAVLLGGSRGWKSPPQMR